MSASEVDGYDGSRCSSKCLRKTTTKAQDKGVKEKNLKKATKWKIGYVPLQKIEDLISFLYSKQTLDEKTEASSKAQNSVGFNREHAAIYTPIAERLKRGDHLTDEEEKQARKQLPIYWKQYLNGGLFNQEELLAEYAQRSNKNEKKELKRKAYFVNDGRLYLEILTTDEHYQFAHLDDSGDVQLIDSIGDILPVDLPKTKQGELAVIVKMPDEGILSARVLSPPDLLEKIEAHIKKYCDLPDLDTELASYYILFTWFYRKTNTVGYLRFKSDTGKGKSRMLTVISDLCFYPLSVSGSSSFSGMMRTKEYWHGTLVIDEADIQGDKEHQLVKYLNLGFEAGKYFILSDKTDPRRQEVFDPFGPKIIAMREPFKDNATEGRLLSISPHETTNDSIPTILLTAYYEESRELRNEIARFVLAHWNEIDGEHMLPFGGAGIERRLQQLAMPLSIIFQLWHDGEDRFREYIWRRQQELRCERALSWHGSVFNLVYGIASGEEDLRTEDKGQWASFYDSDGEIQAVTPSMVAQRMHTTTRTATETLTSIGFEVERRRILVPVVSDDEKPVEKAKQVRAYVVPSDAMWAEIVQRYYDAEGGSDGCDGCDTLPYKQHFLAVPTALQSKTFIPSDKPVYPRSVTSVTSVTAYEEDSGSKHLLVTDVTDVTDKIDTGQRETTTRIVNSQDLDEDDSTKETEERTFVCPCSLTFDTFEEMCEHQKWCDVFHGVQSREAMLRMQQEEQEKAALDQ